MKTINPLKKAFLLLVCLAGISLLSIKAQSGIEGKWKDPKNGVVVLIYEEDGKYFGQLVESENPEQNELIQAQEKIVLLRDFEKKNETKFCCGTIYQPKYKRTLSGTLKLEDENTLKVTGKMGPVKRSQVWTRI